MVARDLGMSPGKVGAQCAHAAVGLYRQLAVRRAPWLRAWEVMALHPCCGKIASFYAAERDVHAKGKRGYAAEAHWLTCLQESGEKTIVLGVDSSAEVLELAHAADAASLQSYAVHDAGRTEVAAGSLTVLGIGGFSEMVDVVTGHLQTL